MPTGAREGGTIVTWHIRIYANRVGYFQQLVGSSVLIQHCIRPRAHRGDAKLKKLDPLRILYERSYPRAAGRSYPS